MKNHLASPSQTLLQLGFAKKQGAVRRVCPLYLGPVTLALGFGAIHALVDAASAAVVYTEVAFARLPFDAICHLVILYNVLAFGTQFVVGLVTDYRKAYRWAAAFGTWAMTLAVFAQQYSAVFAVVFAGIGNSLFHVGAGALVLQLSGGRAREAGLFVAPGALGLTMGLWLGLNAFPWRWSLIPVLVLSGLFVLKLPAREDGQATLSKRVIASSPLLACVGLLLASVSIRALVGGVFSGSWRESQTAIFALAGLAVAGKALGGVIADRIGWRILSVGALLLSAPFVVFAPGHLAAALLGMFVFQMTMPVTLEAVYVAFPTRPGLAFGLPCLALLLGALPRLTGLTAHVGVERFAIPTIVLSACFVFIGLGFLRNPTEDVHSGELTHA